VVAARELVLFAKYRGWLVQNLCFLAKLFLDHKVRGARLSPAPPPLTLTRL